MKKRILWFASTIGLGATLLACSGADPETGSQSTGTALAKAPSKEATCNAICRVGMHCELVASACLAEEPSLIGPCPPLVPQCVPDSNYPTCETSPTACGPGEVCVDVPNDCAPPADGPLTCPPTMPVCELGEPPSKG